VGLAPQVGAEPKFGAVFAMPSVKGASIVNLAPFTSVSCLGATGCTAAGPGLVAIGNGGGVAAHDTNGSRTWSQEPGRFALPANAASSSSFSPTMDAVSCWAVEDCAAVGEYGISESILGVQRTVFTPMAAVETSGVWGTATQITLPVTTDSFGVLTGVSCVATGDCTAAGLDAAYNPSTGAPSFHSMTVTEAGGTWTTAAVRTDPAGSSYLIPTAISCLTGSDCAYVEANESSKLISSYVVTEVAGTWSTPQPLAAPKAAQWLAESISCTGGGACVTAGVSARTAAPIENAGTTYPATAVESGGVWSRAVQQRLPLLSPLTTSGGLTSVSCASPSLCVAVGLATTASNARGVPIALTYNGVAWSSIGLYPGRVAAGDKPALTSAFTSVSCFSTTSCMALGEASTATANAPRANAFSFSDLVRPAGVATRPGVPISLKVAGSKVRTVLTWAPPYSDGGASITRFNVKVTSPREPTRACMTRRLECSFAGLVKGHVYRFIVQDQNAVGPSAPSHAVAFKAR
jgi:hypothetical protein